MKKIYQKALLFLMILISLTIGICIQTEFKGEEIQITKIAVVNMDEGHLKEQQLFNYANLMLSNREDFIFTSLSDAKTGLENGTYAAYVIVPESFSSKIESIDTTPNTIILEYEISDELSKTVSRDILINIYQLQEDLNNQIGMMYLTSILNEFHQGQTNANDIVHSNEKFKELLLSFNTEDLYIVMDEVELPVLQTANVNFDLNQEMSELNTHMSEILEMYRDKNEILEINFDELVEIYKELHETIIYQNSQIDELEVYLNEYTEEQKKYLLESYFEIISINETNFDRINENLNEEVNGLSERIHTVLKEKLKGKYSEAELIVLLDEMDMELNSLNGWLEVNGNEVKKIDALKDEEGYTFNERIDSEYTNKEIIERIQGIARIDGSLMEQQLIQFHDRNPLIDMEDEFVIFNERTQKLLLNILEDGEDYEKLLISNEKINYDSMILYLENLLENTQNREIHQKDILDKKVNTIHSTVNNEWGNSIEKLRLFSSKLPYTKLGEQQNTVVKNQILNSIKMKINYHEPLNPQLITQNYMFITVLIVLLISVVYFYHKKVR